MLIANAQRSTHFFAAQQDILFLVIVVWQHLFLQFLAPRSSVLLASSASSFSCSCLCTEYAPSPRDSPNHYQSQSQSPARFRSSEEALISALRRRSNRWFVLLLLLLCQELIPCVVVWQQQAHLGRKCNCLGPNIWQMRRAERFSQRMHVFTGCRLASIHCPCPAFIFCVCSNGICKLLFSFLLYFGSCF